MTLERYLLDFLPNDHVTVMRKFPFFREMLSGVGVVGARLSVQPLKFSASFSVEIGQVDWVEQEMFGGHVTC